MKRSDELRVVSAGCTPVKGLRHQARPGLRCDDFGPLGDRGYCVVDTENQRVLKTVRNPTLLALTATEVGSELEITTPSGERVREVPQPTDVVVRGDYWNRTIDLRLTTGRHGELLSSWLGRQVALARAARGAVVYNEAVTIVTTASLRDLGDRIDHPDLVAEAARFRATLVVETDEPYVEDSWLGCQLRAGEVQLKIGGPVFRCGVIDLDPVSGERHERLLKALADYRPRSRSGEPAFGVTASVIAPGAFMPPSMHVPAGTSHATSPTLHDSAYTAKWAQ